MGVLLLVAMAVTVAGAPLVYLKLTGDIGEPAVSGTRTAIAAGPGDWGDGDEVVEIHHHSGRTLRAADVEVVIRVNRALTVVDGTAGSADGATFAGPGAPWRHTLHVPAGAEVEVEVHWQRLMTDQLLSNEIVRAPDALSGGARGQGDGGGAAGGGADEEGPAQPVVVCHVPPGHSDAAHNLSIDPSARQAHLDHGDHEGPCDGTEGTGAGGDGEEEGDGAPDGDAGDDTGDGAGEEGTTLCHIPPGNPGARHTITVGSQGAVNAHLGHGDHLGPCGGEG